MRVDFEEKQAAPRGRGCQACPSEFSGLDCPSEMGTRCLTTLGMIHPQSRHKSLAQVRSDQGLPARQPLLVPVSSSVWSGQQAPSPDCTGQC